MIVREGRRFSASHRTFIRLQPRAGASWLHTSSRNAWSPLSPYNFRLTVCTLSHQEEKIRNEGPPACAGLDKPTLKARVLCAPQAFTRRAWSFSVTSVLLMA